MEEKQVGAGKHTDKCHSASGYHDGGHCSTLLSSIIPDCGVVGDSERKILFVRYFDRKLGTGLSD